jgi:hypothetical protein
MTIAVRIENKDASRSIEVLEVNYDKERGNKTEGPPVRIAPGSAHSFHVYQLRDLRVREIDPRLETVS